MKKKRKLTKKSRSSRRTIPSRDRGFDFGHQMGVMSVADIDFNQALMDANIFACAYGLQPIEGLRAPIPAITLVGDGRAGFLRAFDHFKRWGCEEDGDVVDGHMLLRADGGYEMWIGPEMMRSLYRTIPQADLYRAVAFNLSWIKRFDTTHSMLRDLKGSCAASLSPVAITAAIGDRNNPDIHRITPITGVPIIIKFQLRLVEETAQPQDPRFRLRVEKRHPTGKQSPQEPPSPAEFCIQRKKVLDIAFPVSRERVRRADHL